MKREEEEDWSSVKREGLFSDKEHEQKEKKNGKRKMKKMNVCLLFTLK